MPWRPIKVVLSKRLNLGHAVLMKLFADILRKSVPHRLPIGRSLTKTDCVTSDKVYVGACVDLADSSRFVCAVNEDACDSQYSFWVPTSDVKKQLGADCFLCAQENEQEATGSSTSNGGPFGRAKNVDQQDSSDQDKPVLLIGFILIGAVVVVSLISWFRRREARLRAELVDVRLELQNAHYSDSDNDGHIIETKEIL